MNVAGIDAHATYLVVAIVSNTGELLYYDEQKRRVGWQTARVATARKLARARSARSGLRPTRYGHIPAAANRWLRSAFVQGVVSHVCHAPSSWLSR